MFKTTRIVDPCRHSNLACSLHILLRLADALLRNEDTGLEPYVHQLLPALLTCLVARNIGGALSSRALHTQRTDA
jgi:hypothetical protein